MRFRYQLQIINAYILQLSLALSVAYKNRGSHFNQNLYLQQKMSATQFIPSQDPHQPNQLSQNNQQAQPSPSQSFTQYIGSNHHPENTCNLSKTANDDSSQVKYEEGDLSERADRKIRGRPRKQTLISADTLKNSQARSIASTNSINGDHSERSLRQVPISVFTKKSKLKKVKLKVSDPTEQDLCEALMIIKKKLPHRSLQRAIIKLFDTVQKEKKEREATATDCNRSVSAESMFIKRPESLMQQTSQKEASIASQQNNSQNGSCEGASKATGAGQRFEKMILPGRKTSCYHEGPADIAAISHEYYKNSAPTLQEIETLQKNLGNLPIYSKPRPEHFLDAQVKQEQSAITKALTNNFIYRFTEAQTLKTSFLNPHDQQIYKNRRNLAKIFIERGFGFTKSIDADLPPMEIGREAFRNKLGGILTEPFRKFESFLTADLGLTLKYLDRQQMRTIAMMLINCRVHLQIDVMEGFFKWIRITYGLGDITVTKSQAIHVYVGIMKHLYGKNITIEELERKGRISNQRNLQEKVPILRKLAQQIIQKKQKSQGARLRLGTISEAEPIEQRTQSFNTHLWTPEIDRQLINLYVEYKDIERIKSFMQQFFSSLAQTSLEEFKERLQFITRSGLSQIQEAAKSSSHKQLTFFTKMSQYLIVFIVSAPETEAIRVSILKYWLAPSPQNLQASLKEISQLFKADNAQQTQDLEFCQEINFGEIDQISQVTKFEDSQMWNGVNENGVAKSIDGMDLGFLEELKFQQME